MFSSVSQPVMLMKSSSVRSPGSILTCRLVLSSMLALALSHSSFAQSSKNVAFRSGDYGAMLTGSITGRQYFDYKVKAKAHQKMFVDLAVAHTNGDGTIYLNILPPGSDGVAIYNGSSDTDRSETVPLPSDGVYTIRLYLMGNDRDSGKTVAYRLDMSIQ